MLLKAGRNVLDILNKPLRTEYRSLRNAARQGDVVRVRRIEPNNLLSFGQEIGQPVQRPVPDSEPSTLDVQQNGVVDGVEHRRQVEEDTNADVTLIQDSDHVVQHTDHCCFRRVTRTVGWLDRWQ